jgi:hypothetical protein
VREREKRGEKIQRGGLIERGEGESMRGGGREGERAREIVRRGRGQMGEKGGGEDRDEGVRGEGRSEREKGGGRVRYREKGEDVE